MGDPSPGPVLSADLRTLATRVRRADLSVRADDADGVHDLRVAMRRIRSLLRTFRALLEPDLVAEAERLRVELRWAGGALSAVRDLEVVERELFLASADESLPGSVEARLEQHRDEAGRAARQQVADLLASERYARMGRDLDALAARTVWGAADLASARALLLADWRRLRRRAVAAEAVLAGGDAEVALHEVRKAAKRARYAAEVLAPLLGDEARSMAGVAERVQEALGTHRDTLLTCDVLRRLGLEQADEEHAFALGRLHAHEERRGAESLYDYARARLELDRRA